MLPRIALLAASCTMIACVAAADPNEDDRGADSVDKKVEAIATISYAPNSFVIGNAYRGWTIDVQGEPQFSSGPGNPSGASYRWGFVYGAGFDRCAWIDDGELGPATTHDAARCGARQEIDTPYFLATYTNGMHNDLAGDGSPTHMHWAGDGCADRNGYGNVMPWRVPATPTNSLGTIEDGRFLRWRYVSRDGRWVLVRDPAPTKGDPNWFFVHRGCVSLASGS